MSTHPLQRGIFRGCRRIIGRLALQVRSNSGVERQRETDSSD